MPADTITPAKRSKAMNINPADVSVYGRGTADQALTVGTGGGMGSRQKVPMSGTSQPLGSVPTSLTAKRAGSTISADQGLLQRAAGGVSRTTTRTPMYSPLSGQLLSLQEQSTVESPLAPQDLAAAALGDVEAFRQAKEESRGIAEQALAGVEGSYGAAVDELTSQLGESKAAIRAQQPGFGDVQGSYQKAWQAREQAAEQARTYAEEQTERAEAYRAESFEEYRSEFALRHDALRRGMETDFNRRMGGVDDAVARGAVVGSSGMSAGQVGSAMKAQVKSEYKDQLRALAGQLSSEESRISANLRSTVDQFTLASIGQAQATAAGVEGQMAGVAQQLAASEANARAVFSSGAQYGELGLLQADLAIQKMRVEEPALATEIMLSQAYLPDSISLYPLMKQLSDIYDADIGTQGTAVVGGVSYEGSPIQTGFEQFFGGGDAQGAQQTSSGYGTASGGLSQQRDRAFEAKQKAGA